MGRLVNATPRPLNLRERPRTHCIGDWLNRRAGLDGGGRSRLRRDSFPGSCSEFLVKMRCFIVITFQLYCRICHEEGYRKPGGCEILMAHISFWFVLMMIIYMYCKNTKATKGR